MEFSPNSKIRTMMMNAKLMTMIMTTTILTAIHVILDNLRDANLKRAPFNTLVKNLTTSDQGFLSKLKPSLRVSLTLFRTLSECSNLSSELEVARSPLSPWAEGSRRVYFRFVETYIQPDNLCHHLLRSIQPDYLYHLLQPRRGVFGGASG